MICRECQKYERYEVSVCTVDAHDKKRRIATVQIFFFFFVWVAISQYRGSELLASLQGMWLGALCPGGEAWERKKKLSQ